MPGNRRRQIGPLDPIYDVETSYGSISVGNTPSGNIFPTGGDEEDVTDAGVTYRYHIFLDDGTLEWSGSARTVEYCFAGGGAGSGGFWAFICANGGGGAGEVVTGSAIIGGSVSVDIGQGGLFGGTGSGAPGNPGEDTVVGGITAHGGCGGGTNAGCAGLATDRGGDAGDSVFAGSGGSGGGVSAGGGGGAGANASGNNGGLGVVWPPNAVPSGMPNAGWIGGGGNGANNAGAYGNCGVGGCLYGGGSNDVHRHGLPNTGGGACGDDLGATLSTGGSGLAVFRYIIS